MSDLNAAITAAWEKRDTLSVTSKGLERDAVEAAWATFQSALGTIASNLATQKADEIAFEGVVFRYPGRGGAGGGDGGNPDGPSKAATASASGARSRPSATVGVGKWLASPATANDCTTAPLAWLSP